MRYSLLQTKSRALHSWGGGAGHFAPILIRPAKVRVNTEMPFQLLVSVATIEREESEFTALPDKRRRHLLLAGKTVLTVDGVETRLEGHFPQHAFCGAAKARCRLLSSQARALNAIFAPGVEVLPFEPLSAPGCWRLGNTTDFETQGLAATWKLVDILFCVDGSLELATVGRGSKSGKRYALEPEDALLLERRSEEAMHSLSFEGSGSAVAVRIGFRDRQ